MEKNITFGDMADALHKLRERYGIYYNPSENEILREALRKNEKK